MKKIVLKPHQNLWITSDSHYSHSNICSATTEWTNSKDITRKFSSLELMNETLVRNINAAVKADDILIHLGDWSFGGFYQIAKFRSQLNVKDIRIVLGNHDHHIKRNKEDIQSIFTEVWDGIVNLNVRYEHQTKKQSINMVLCHYPIASWMNMDDGWFHLHGHVHLPYKHHIGQGRSMDVGVDGNGYSPHNFNEIVETLSKQPIKHLTLPQDHHSDD